MYSFSYVLLKKHAVTSDLGGKEGGGGLSGLERIKWVDSSLFL